MTPPGWGHSLLLGRVKYLLKWTFEDLTESQCVQLLQYLRAQQKFPDIIHFGSNVETNKALMNVDSLQAFEVASAMVTMLFGLICISPPLSGKTLQSWRLQNVLAVDYFRFGFTSVQREAHMVNWKFFCSAFQSAYINNHSERTLDNKIKFHDPEHNLENIIHYGNFRIINELAKEAVHQLPKKMAHNNREVEKQMLYHV